jgi:hypothetical protein
MTAWAWAGVALLLLGWGGTAWWLYQLAATAQRLHADLVARLSASQQAEAAVHDQLDRTLAAWAADVARCRADFSSDAQASREEIRHLRAHLDQSAAHVKALSEAQVLADQALQARADWVQAFNRNFNPATQRDLDPAPAKGWQCVLLEAGQPVSVRAIRDGNAPTRISRAHGDDAEWYRLVRVDGLSLIYEPEMDPA